MVAALENCRAMLSMVLPHKCLGCGLPTNKVDKYICNHCIPYMPWLEDHCFQCAGDLENSSIKCAKCRSQQPVYDRVCAIFKYKPPFTHILYKLKYGKKLEYAQIIGKLLAEHITDFWYKNLDLPQLIIPVPLHKTCLGVRGFNQALEIAKVVGTKTKVSVGLRTCQLIRNTISQESLSNKNTMKNTVGAFIANTSARHVAIIDDVVTTGSTVRAMSNALRDSGVQEIDIWCLCRG